MDFNDSFLSEEHRELLKSVTESADPISASPIEVVAVPKFPSPHQGKHGSSRGGSVVKHDRHSHSRRGGHPKKGTSAIPFFINFFLIKISTSFNF